ncbi:hypothetical protein GEMRC1_012915 [Eukaryota sp. GEM-RC1]
MLHDVNAKRDHSFTVDNAPTLHAALNRINYERSELGKGCILKMRCFAHILNIVLQAGLLHVENTCEKIRKLAQTLAGSTQLTQEFRDCFEDLNIRSIRRDVKTRWNSTYFMLCTYLKRLQAINLFFTTTENEDISELQLTSKELANVRCLCDILKVFYNATNTVSYSTCSVGPSVVMFAEIERQLDIQENNNQHRPWVLRMISSMKDKLVTYHDHIYNFTTYVAMLLDPRFKTRLMPLKLKTENFREQFKEYFISHQPSLDNESVEVQPAEPAIVEGEVVDIEPVPKCSLHLAVSHLVDQHEEPIGELDSFELGPLEPLTSNPLNFWKHRTDKYPVLSSIARQFLAVQVSSVASERCFSVSGRTLSKTRNRLSDEVLEVLLCLKSWYAMNLNVPS